jgi:hypothetical protein
MPYPAQVRRPRRRRWPLLVPVAVIVLAIAWCGGWFYASSLARTAIDGWREREAKSGRIYNCGEQEIGGFPFRIEVRCVEATAQLHSNQPPLALTIKEILVAAQIYQPTLLISDFTAPLAVAELGGPPEFVAGWTLARSSMRGLPQAPERISLAVDQLNVDRIAGGNTAAFFKAERAEVHGRISSGTVTDNPVIDLVLRLTAAATPTLHPLLAQPFDADITTLLRGLADFSPKPWPQRFREIQTRGGHIEIAKARVQQGDVIAVGAGKLGLSPRGGLEGQIQVTIVGLDKVLKMLDLDRALSQGQVGSAIGALDRLVPGLGQVARQNAGPGIMLGLGAIGKNTTLEGKAAVALPLRFVDGAVFLGPIPVGQIPPLF